jgi:uncharacterized protein
MATMGAKLQTKQPSKFFVWVMALSTPFYMWGAIRPVRGLPFGLPATAVMVVLPAAVATILTRRNRGGDAAWALWRRVGDVERIQSTRWLAISLLCMPAVSLLGYAIMWVLRMPLPTVISVPLVRLPMIFAVFFVGAVLEEIGWTGYATEPLQQQSGILGAGITIGAVWALWHLVPWWLGQAHPLTWVCGQTLATIAMRIVMGWIYAFGGRSLLLAVLFHTMINTSYSLFPNGGSHYNPWAVAGPLIIIAGLIALHEGRRRVCRINIEVDSGEKQR